VGVETEIFKRQHGESNSVKKESASVLFYGQFIPLHGIDIIIKAAQLAQQKHAPVRWTIIGKGQEEKRIDALIKKADITTILRVLWVGYEELSRYIHSADICLGIFGTSEKALRVIPNKVFQICAVGKPLITADTPAIRELLSPGQMILLIPPGDPAALFEAVCSLTQQSFSEAMVTRECPIIDNKVILNQCDALFDKVVS
jgi:glycosyltransferase involved in cell wall biosynthesis